MKSISKATTLQIAVVAVHAVLAVVYMYLFGPSIAAIFQSEHFVTAVGQGAIRISLLSIYLWSIIIGFWMAFMVSETKNSKQNIIKGVALSVLYWGLYFAYYAILTTYGMTWHETGIGELSGYESLFHAFNAPIACTVVIAYLYDLVKRKVASK